MAKHKYLLVAYGGGHVNMMIPLYRKMVERHWNVTFLACTTAQLRLSAEEIPFVSFRELLLNDPEREFYTTWGEKLVGDIEGQSLLPREESVAYLGISYGELVKSQGTAKAAELYASRGRQCFLPVETLKRYMRSEKITFVITTNSPRSERAAILAARDLGLKNLCLLDSIDVSSIEESVKHPGYGQKVCVPDKAAKEVLLARGRPASEIVVTGNPAFSHLKKLTSREVHELRAKLRLGQKKVVTWIKSFSHHSAAFEEKVEKFLEEKFASSDEYFLLYRPHPSDPKFYDEAIGLHDDKYRISREPLNVLLNLSDVVVTLVSTVAVEASLLGKPVVQISIEKPHPWVFFFDHYEHGTEAKDWPSLERLIREGVNRATQIEVVPPAESVDNILQVIETL